jgi:long-chain acyl-CoA synthetase
MAPDPAGQAPLPAALDAVLAGHAAGQPERTFLIAPENGRIYTYADLDGQARRLDAALAAHGLARGDTVAMLLHNGWQTAAIFLGSMARGYVCAPLNLISQRSQLAYVIEHSDCKLVFTSSDYEERLLEALEDVGPRSRWR